MSTASKLSILLEVNLLPIFACISELRIITKKTELTGWALRSKHTQIPPHPLGAHGAHHARVTHLLEPLAWGTGASKAADSRACSPRASCWDTRWTKPGKWVCLLLTQKEDLYHLLTQLFLRQRPEVTRRAPFPPAAREQWSGSLSPSSHRRWWINLERESSEIVPLSGQGLFPPISLTSTAKA